MPRILIAGFCTLPGPDRPGVQLRHVVRALVRDSDVDIIVARHGDQAYVERFDTARLLRVPIPDGEFTTQVEAFRRALRRQLEGAEYDVVHARDGWAAAPALELRSRLGYALVFDAARAPLSDPSRNERAVAVELARLEEACLRRADLVLAPTEAARPQLSHLVEPARVHVAPPGVDVDVFDWDDAPQEGPPRILYLGSLSPGRGLRVLLRAMVELAPRTDAVLVLAGRAAPSFRAKLEKLVSDLNLDGRVELPGAIPYEDVPAEIARASVCVAPRALELGPLGTELYPTKLLEYMACMRPVVAPRRSSVTMMMRDGQHGLLFEPAQPADLALKLAAVLGDPLLRERLVRNAYELVRRVHTASSTRRQLRSAYRWLAAQEPWRDKLAAKGDATDRLPMPTSDFAGGVAVNPQSAGGRALTAYDSEGVILDDTGSLQLDDVTKVETHPITGELDDDGDETAIASPGWVEPGPAREGKLASPPPQTVFVAGELEVPAPSAAAAGETAETPVIAADEHDTAERDLEREVGPRQEGWQGAESGRAGSEIDTQVVALRALEDSGDPPVADGGKTPVAPPRPNAKARAGERRGRAPESPATDSGDSR